MATIKHKSFDVTVQTIIDRNNIPHKVDHMTVLVLDAIADINAGAGKATYRWDASDSSWVLISTSSINTMNFITEEIILVEGVVNASNIPTSSQIWNIVVVDGNTVIAELRLEDIIVTNAEINLSTILYDGKKLRFTYAYGSIAAQIEQVLGTIAIGDVTDLSEALNTKLGTEGGYITGSIIPLNDTIDLGSPTNPFRDLYLSPNTLYINGTPFLSTDTQTGDIVISAGAGQNIVFDSPVSTPAGMVNLIESDIPNLSQSKITGLSTSLSAKQDSLVSGTNIKTINGTTVLGSGNLVISASGIVDATPTDASANPVSSNGVFDALALKLDSNTAITAGTGTKITYDAKGLVLSSTTPTTLAGYSISDAALSTHTHTYSEVDFTATANQTTFSTTYTVGRIQVFIDGIKVKSDQFIATNGTSIVFSVGLEEFSWLQIVKL